MTNRTVRSIPSSFESRAEGDKLYISGYFSVFNSRYDLWDGAYETVNPHAFDDALGDDIRALCDHDTRLVLGRTTAGTLKLRVDDKGLWGDIEINQNDSDAMNLYARVQRGDVSQCSFGFDIKEEEFTDNLDGSVHWEIMSVKLYEVSVCTFPAYTDTSVSARKADLANQQKRSFDLKKNEISKRLEAIKNA